jgi:hypothetical protein
VTTGLTAKIVALHDALDAATIPHAFGGALALAFCTAEPRATRDIDVNVFCDPKELARVEAALPRAFRVTTAQRKLLLRDGQARLWWAETPVDLFLANHTFHQQAAANRRVVPFAGVDLPVLACADLAVFKAFFARPKDAVDLATMAHVGTIDLDELATTVTALLGSDERAAFLARVHEVLSEFADEP